MLDSQIAILENAIARYQATGEPPGPLGARHPSITPFEAFATRDGHVVIAAGNDRLFETLCITLERRDLLERGEFSTNDLRTQHHEALRTELEATLRGEATEAWLAKLEAAEIPSGPINDVASALADPQVRARNMVVTVPRSTRGGTETIEIAGNPIKLSGADDPTSRPPARPLDADRDALLREFAPELRGEPEGDAT